MIFRAEQFDKHSKTISLQGKLFRCTMLFCGQVYPEVVLSWYFLTQLFFCLFELFTISFLVIRRQANHIGDFQDLVIYPKDKDLENIRITLSVVCLYICLSVCHHISGCYLLILNLHGMYFVCNFMMIHSLINIRHSSCRNQPAPITSVAHIKFYPTVMKLSTV